MDWRDRLAECIGFQWDQGNWDKNWVRHGLLPSECESAFFNEPLLVVGDTAHSSEAEQRYYALARTDTSRLLYLVFTLRRGYIRIISARDMSRKERKVYNAYEKGNPAI